ncbi:helix-turn-helix transcriptional regulator [Streptomyces sodiiphilus]
MDDSGVELGGFLRSRRARVSPQSAGVRAGSRRRVPGLRREELAQLAGISVDYYVRLEQGRARQPSGEVLDALARVLELCETEREHLGSLASGRRRGPHRTDAHCPPRAPGDAAGDDPGTVGPGLRRVLDGMAGLPAVITGHRQDVLAWNTLGSLLFGDVAGRGPKDRNHARYLFLAGASRELFPDWERRARETVAVLRLSAGQYPGDALLAGLLAELAERSADFRRMWAAADVFRCGSGERRYRHRELGELVLGYQAFQLPGGPGEYDRAMHVLTAEEGSAAQQALRVLAAAG